MATDDQQEAIDACSCPRAEGEHLTAPRCPVVKCLGGDGLDFGILFIDAAAVPAHYCSHAVYFGTGVTCTCKNRFRVYRAYRL